MSKEINHSQRAHALLSPSGSERWLNCTPSPRLEENFGSESTSVYAEEGTLAHELAEIDLLEFIGVEVDFDKKMEALNHHLYSDEMEEEVEKYTNYVKQQFTEARRKNEDAILSIEQRIDLSSFIEDGSGSNDSIIICDGVLEVMDLKYGKGVRVKSEENTQLMLYGLGALIDVEMMFDIKEVKLTIIQPRLNSIDSWIIKADELRNWGENFVKQKAELAFKGEGDLNPGSWCKWCKIKNRCSALSEMNLKIFKEELSDPRLLSDEQILEIYEKLPMFNEWSSDLSSYISSEAIKGKKWPGYKLVEGRSNRKWSDPDLVIQRLEKLKFEKEKFTKTSLETLAKIEKLVGKTVFTVELGDLLIKPKGSPTLVSESDPRPEFTNNSPMDDFGTEDQENLY